jgi:hypothetical protein
VGSLRAPLRGSERGERGLIPILLKYSRINIPMIRQPAMSKATLEEPFVLNFRGDKEVCVSSATSRKIAQKDPVSPSKAEPDS